MDLSNPIFAPLSVDSSEKKLIDLRHLLAIGRERIWWIVGVVAIVLALTVGAYIAAPRSYTATASIALDRRVDELVVQGAPQPDLPTDSPTVDTAVQVLTSPALAGEVVDALDLGDLVGFIPTQSAAASSALQRRQSAVSTLAAGLDVKRIGTSYAISVGYTYKDPKVVAQIVNAIAQQYITDQLKQKAATKDRDVRLLAERIATLRSQVVDAETKEAKFRGSTNLIDVNKDSTAVQQEISVLGTQLATAQSDQAAANARLSAFRTSGGGGDDAAMSPALHDLQARQSLLASQRADLAGRYGPKYPDLANLDRQLDQVNQDIARQAARTQANLSAEARVSAGRVGAIQSSLARAQAGLQAGNSSSVSLNELTRNADSARSLYQSLLDRYRQAVAGQGTEESDAYIVAHAAIPSIPAFPKPVMFAAAGLIVSLAAAGGVVALIESMERGFKSRKDVESKLNIPVLASIPDLHRMPGLRLNRKDEMAAPDYLIDNQGSAFSEAFRCIRGALKLGTKQAAIKSLAVCSALPAEGKTTASICLARSAALSGLHVVLIDCDVRRASSSRLLLGKVSAGLMEVLAGKISLADALVKDAASGAWILPQTGNSTDYELITSPTMISLLEALTRECDLVVLDTAPILPLADARAVASMADGVLLITRWGSTPVNAAELALEMLGRAGAKVVGSVLSVVNVARQTKTGSDDEMVYYNRFKKYYT